MNNIKRWGIGLFTILFTVSFVFGISNVTAVPVEEGSTPTLFGYNDEQPSGGGGGNGVVPEIPEENVDTLPEVKPTTKPEIKPMTQQIFNDRLAKLPQTGFVNSSFMILIGLILLAVAMLTYDTLRRDKNKYNNITIGRGTL